MKKVLFIILLLALPYNAMAGSLDELRSISSSSLLLVNEQQKILETKDADKLFIPASTIKILTSLMALDYWGRDHRFKTNFYFDSKSNSLWVKGYGDPYLVSEELDLIIEKIRSSGIHEIDNIGIDNTYFSKTIHIDGQGGTLNPYDATVGATATNFNTINVRVYEDAISSSEKQTPLTPLVNELAQGLPVGTHRINLENAENSPRYFFELLKAKLNQTGIPTESMMLRGEVPATSTLIFSHQNSKKLDEIISAMLEFSNNFIANQLYLKLGAELYDAPASMEKSQRMLQSYIAKNFNWKTYVLVEGAGLSRHNKLSAKQLIDILNKFHMYRDLMPNQSNEIFAKTGTLSGVSTYAGYINRNNSWSPFAIMINQPVEFNFRKRVAVELLN